MCSSVHFGQFTRQISTSAAKLNVKQPSVVVDRICPLLRRSFAAVLPGYKTRKPGYFQPQPHPFHPLARPGHWRRVMAGRVIRSNIARQLTPPGKPERGRVGWELNGVPGVGWRVMGSLSPPGCRVFSNSKVTTIPLV